MADGAKRFIDTSTTKTYVPSLEGFDAVPVGALEQENVDGEWVFTGREMGPGLQVIDMGGGGNGSGGGTEPRTGEIDPNADFNEEEALAAETAAVEQEQGVNTDSGPGYLPGQYNPTSRIRFETDAAVDPSLGSTNPEAGGYINSNRVEYFARGDLESMSYANAPGGEGFQNLVDRATKAYSGMDNATPAQKNGVYRDAIAAAAATGMTVQEALENIIKTGNGLNGAVSGTGRSGPTAFTNRTKQLVMTDPGTAERVLNQALAGYLGRRASDDEVQEFVTQLNRNERFNPVTQVSTGVRSQSGTTQTTTQEGGFDAATFAERWAASREGASEYQAATTYMDAFQQAINEMEF